MFHEENLEHEKPLAEFLITEINHKARLLLGSSNQLIGTHPRLTMDRSHQMLESMLELPEPLVKWMQEMKTVG